MAGVGIWAAVGHGQHAFNIADFIRWRDGIQLVGKRRAKSAQASAAVAARVAALDNKAFGHAMESQTVIKAGVGKAQKILHGFGRVAWVKLHLDFAEVLHVYFHRAVLDIQSGVAGQFTLVKIPNAR